MFSQAVGDSLVDSVVSDHIPIFTGEEKFNKAVNSFSSHDIQECAVMFSQAVGDSLVDSVVSDNIPIFTEEEKFNEAVSSIVKRIEAKLTGAEKSLTSSTSAGQSEHAEGLSQPWEE